MNHLIRSTPRLLAALAALTSAAHAFQMDDVEVQFIQTIDFATNAPIANPQTIDEALAGTFLSGGAGRPGLMVLREDQGVRELIYRDSFLVWNTGDAYTLEDGLYDCALVTAGGPGGLDAMATVSSAGLRIHAANASDDGFEVVASLSSWTGQERVFAIQGPQGLTDIYGYDAPTRQMRRAVYDSATQTLTQAATFIAPGGLRDMVSVELSAAHAGRELAFCSSLGWLIVTSADASQVVAMHDGRQGNNGQDLIQVLATNGPGAALLAWKSIDPGHATERVVIMDSSGILDSHSLSTTLVQSMAAADVNGDGLDDLVLGASSATTDHHLLVWKRDSNTGLFDASTDPTTHGHELIRGTFYADAQPDKIIAADIDNDSDVDIFAISGIYGTIDHILNGAGPDLRPTWNHMHGTVASNGTTVSMDGHIAVPDDRTWNPNLRLRLRVWPRGSVSKQWDMKSRAEWIFPVPTGNLPDMEISADIVVDCSQTPGWDMGTYLLLTHAALIEVDAGGNLTKEYPTGVTVFAKGSDGHTWVLEKNLLESNGDDPGGLVTPNGGETTTTSSGSADDGTGPPPGSEGN